MRGLVIVPTYNERHNIESLVHAIMDLGQGLDVLVVDDNSPDGTGEIALGIKKANPRVHVLSRPKKQGLKHAYMAGYQWALSGAYDPIIQMDADFSHNPKAIPLFLKEARSHDLVIGSRYMDGGGTANLGLHRLALSHLANRGLRHATDMPFTDLTSGYKCFKRKALLSIDLGAVKSRGYIFQVEMSHLAWKNDLRIKEIPIVFTDRIKGKTKISGTIVLEGMVMLIKLHLLKWGVSQRVF